MDNPRPLAADDEPETDEFGDWEIATPELAFFCRSRKSVADKVFEILKRDFTWKGRNAMSDELAADEYWVVIGEDGKPDRSDMAGIFHTKFQHQAIGQAWWRGMGKPNELKIRRARITVEVVE